MDGNGVSSEQPQANTRRDRLSIAAKKWRSRRSKGKRERSASGSFNYQMEDVSPFESHLSSIFPYISAGGDAIKGYHLDMAWYEYWVHEQLQDYLNLSQKPVGNFNISRETWEYFHHIWMNVARSLNTQNLPSINEILLHISQEQLELEFSTAEAITITRDLVFTMIGWQTMLYKPDVGSSPASQLALSDELNGYLCNSRMVLKQQENVCKKPIVDFLMGFGILLPPTHFKSLHSTADQSFHEIKLIESSTCNGFLAITIGRLAIKWIDSLSSHLEFDQVSKVLYLYRHPSFCVANLSGGNKELLKASPLQSCALENPSGKPWASQKDVNQLLLETITTYRLLFGQTKQSRQLYRKINPYKQVSVESQDSLLTELCGRKQNVLADLIDERDSYNLSRDFPIYRARLAALQQYLSMTKPRTWKDLWKDRRDSAQWLTFWVVVIIGGLGLLLAFAQVILQIVQVIVSIPRPPK